MFPGKTLSRFVMKHVLRMEVVDENEGDWPDQYVLPTAPHTSNRDFPYGIFVRPLIGQWINFVAKDSLFKWPVGPILKALGGVPVVRARSTNFVDAVAGIFRTKKDFKLCIAVEGTRGPVDRFKTGFYFIALKAGVPLILCTFDFGNRKLRFSKPMYLTGDIRADFDKIYRHYDGVLGRVPENSFVYDPKVLDLLPEVRES